MSGNFFSCSKGVKDTLEVPEVRCDLPGDVLAEMGLISPGGENLPPVLHESENVSPSVATESL